MPSKRLCVMPEKNQLQLGYVDCRVENREGLMIGLTPFTCTEEEEHNETAIDNAVSY